jgi:cyclophilin family peptidyl-prolyl cis-trans isomerase
MRTTGSGAQPLAFPRGILSAKAGLDDSNPARQPAVALSNNLIKIGSPHMKLVLALAFTASLYSAAPAADKNPVVVIETSHGKIKVELNQEKAPITVKNFLGYVDDKFYDNTIFHRVIADFMIQGGGFEPGMKEKDTKEAIKNESTNGLSNARGTIAMARTRAPNSATAQFYINVKDNAKLDKANADDDVGYCVFGKVIDGMDVVDKIKGVKTETKGRNANVPSEDVVIKSIRREEK